MTLSFDYVDAARPDKLIARGAQEVHCKARRGELWHPAPFPVALIDALHPFADNEELRAALDEAREFQLERGRTPNA